MKIRSIDLERTGCIVFLLCLLFIFDFEMVSAQDGGANPPGVPVKLVFIHHSCGENWLTDGHGNLGRSLAENNYFVSDTNYGWGPFGIGDRTDILDWPDWFLGPDRDQILQALYNESGQNSSYSRMQSDPGGENTIVMFKSCFPNSDLAGQPYDPASEENGLTVGSAKRIYNQLLQYFITRPDKLFVVITAPPLQENYHADNARAFNRWLVQDWLRENDYPHENVAVWDYYNVLTDPDNHHRLVDGVVVYQTDSGGNTLFYPDNGDTHPSPAGNRKATAEFVEMLNYFYNRWHAMHGSAVPQPIEPAPGSEEEGQEQDDRINADVSHDSIIDSFEGEPPAGSTGWEAYFDPAAETQLTCAAADSVSYDGDRSLLIRFDIGPGSWGTCALMFPGIQDWSAADGISFAAASKSSVLINLDVYTGLEGNRQSYVSRFSLIDEGLETWSVFTIHWDQFSRVDWETDDTPFDPSRISGIAYGFEGVEDRSQGEIRIDTLSLNMAGDDSSGQDQEDGSDPAMDAADPQQGITDEDIEPDVARSLCPLSLGMIMLAGFILSWIWFKSG